MLQAALNHHRRRHKKRVQEVTVSLAANAAVVAVLSEPGSIFTLKQEQRATLKAFLGGQHVSASLLTGFGKSSAQHRSSPQAVTHVLANLTVKHLIGPRDKKFCLMKSPFLNVFNGLFPRWM